MSDMPEALTFIIIGGVVIVGLMATVVYYLARYYFRTHEKDRELAPGLKDKTPEASPTREKLSESLKTPSSELEGLPPRRSKSLLHLRSPPLSPWSLWIKPKTCTRLFPTHVRPFGGVLKGLLPGKDSLRG